MKYILITTALAAAGCFFWEQIVVLAVLILGLAAMGLVLGALADLISTPGRAASLLAGVLLGVWLGGDD